MVAIVPIVTVAIGFGAFLTLNLPDKAVCENCTTSFAGKTIVKHFEGFSPVTYIDAAGHPTIGYGHLIRDGEEFDEPLSFTQAEGLLEKDLASAERSVSLLAYTGVSQLQFDALVSFTFNLGHGNLEGSTLLRRVNEGDDEAAIGEFRRWVFAGGRKLRGLVLRRKAESELYKQGSDL
ncbi:MAG: lysozyme [Pseudomonadales bacterium]|nr:lysozyme [Pseudomonadales bacterium]